MLGLELVSPLGSSCEGNGSDAVSLSEFGVQWEGRESAHSMSSFLGLSGTSAASDVAPELQATLYLALMHPIPGIDAGVPSMINCPAQIVVMHA